EGSAWRPTTARNPLAGVATAITATALAATAQAQQSPAPPFATTKVADNVYIFRYGNHQSMFIVTPAGVIATDPISERRPATPYIEAIQAVTKAPIKYVIYSHSHFDHIAGGKPNHQPIVTSQNSKQLPNHLIVNEPSLSTHGICDSCGR